jgi:hypothetical protein
LDFSTIPQRAASARKVRHTIDPLLEFNFSHIAEPGDG